LLNKMTERPMQKPQDNKVKNQPTNIVSTAKQETKIEKKQENKIEKKDSLKDTSIQVNKIEEQVKKEIEAKVAEAQTQGSATPTKEEEKKKEKKELVKKDKAVVNGNDLGISKKHSMAICDLIRGRNPESMIHELELIIKYKKPLKMRGEIPHRKGKIMSGRYPINASKVFIKLLKSLSANSQVNGIENPVITRAVANDASRPFKRGGSMRFKRTNVYLETRERIIKSENKEKK